MDNFLFFLLQIQVNWNAKVEKKIKHKKDKKFIFIVIWINILIQIMKTIIKKELFNG